MPSFAYAIIGIAVIFLGSSLGASCVLFFKKGISSKANTLLLGFAAGIMVAASVFSLLIPAIEEAEADWGNWSFVPAAVGFLLGGVFLVLIDRLVPHIHKGTGEEEGLRASGMSKSGKLFMAVTIHNVPEGLAVGLAFGIAYSGGVWDSSALMAALGLAIGIAIQNFPEGAAVTLPLRDSTGSGGKAFGLGVLSGAVEPIAAVLAFFLSAYVSILQPWLLGFAAGAMIFVVAEDLIPDSHIGENPHLGTWGLMVGFALMMVLDIALG